MWCKEYRVISVLHDTLNSSRKGTVEMTECIAVTVLLAVESGKGMGQVEEYMVWVCGEQTSPLKLDMFDYKTSEGKGIYSDENK